MNDQEEVRVVVAGDESTSVAIRKLLAEHGIAVQADEVRLSDACTDRNLNLPMIDDRNYLVASENISPSYRINFKTRKKLRY